MSDLKNGELDWQAQLIISQALSIAVKHLRALEERDELWPVDGEHAEPSNREDMESLLETSFPLYPALMNAEQPQ